MFTSEIHKLLFQKIQYFLNYLDLAESFAIFRAVGLRSLMIIFSIFNSFATRNPLAPTPDNPSKKIFGPSNFFKNAAYAIIEKSLFVLALGIEKCWFYWWSFFC